MRTLKIIALAMCFITSVSAFSQVMPPEKSYIEVNGTAEQDIVPDLIYISITLRERFDGKEKITIEKLEENFRKYLQDIGVPSKDLSLADANSDYVKIRYKTKAVLTKKEFSLKVTTATAVGQVFQGLDKLGINDAYISKVDHTQMEEMRKQLKIKAIQAAKEKAIYLLTAIGEQPGKPLIIRENEPMIYAYKNAMANQVNYEAAAEQKESVEEIEFTKIKIQSSIYIKYEIK